MLPLRYWSSDSCRTYCHVLSTIENKTIPTGAKLIVFAGGGFRGGGGGRGGGGFRGGRGGGGGGFNRGPPVDMGPPEYVSIVTHNKAEFYVIYVAILQICC